MSYDEILKEITNGFTGNTETDIKYLREQMEKYKDHEIATEILRACGRMMFDIIPEERKKDIGIALDNDRKAIENILDEVKFNMFKRDFNKANQLSEALVKKVDKLHLFENDEVSEYYTFDELFEEILYTCYKEPKREIRRAEIPYSSIYLQHGSLMVEQKRYLEARESLEKARRWNPASTDIAFEYMETFKVRREFDQFRELTLMAFDYAFTREALARCYRNLGYYFIERELYKEAMACYLLSMEYDKENQYGMSELYYIQQKTGKKLEEPTEKELYEYAEKYKFPIGPSGDVLGIAIAHGKLFLENDNIEAAKYCFEIVYELTQNKAIKELLDGLE